MKLLAHIRSKSRLKSTDDTKTDEKHLLRRTASDIWTAPNPTATFSSPLLEELLSYVCPHSRDDTYTSCEESMVDGGCMLCDMRDLSQCALVNQQWFKAAQNLLYHNVRIDAVHYCDREEEVAKRRTRSPFIGRNESPKDASQERLQFFSRTVRENGSLADKVQYLKISYMTRESCMSDIARTVSVLRNLLYIDLPDGVYRDEPSSNPLKQEVQRCTNLRYMKYVGGAENSFQSLAHSRHWRHLKTLELSHLEVDSSTILEVRGTLDALREVKFTNLATLDDNIFGSSINGSLAPLAKLILQDLPNISADGLITYLSQPEAKENLTSLSVANTGISPAGYHGIFASSPCLTSLEIVESVSRALPSSALPFLASRSLRTLHYEISNANSSPHVLKHPADSYYSYLASSILSGSLPSLSNLYALSTTLPILLVPPPRPAMSGNRTGTIPSQLMLGITRPLTLYTKTISELEWDLTLIMPPTSVDRRLSAMSIGPMSLQGPQLSPQWRDKGRESVMVGNGFGGFLAVPTDNNLRAGNAKVKNKRQDSGAWMG